MYKAIVFDFFDVIHQDPQKAWLARHGYKREGGFAEASDLLDTGVIGYSEYIERFAKHSSQTPQGVRSQFQEAKLNHDVKELVRALRATHRTALLSNTCPEEINPIFETHGLPELFDEIIISAEVGLRKPDSAIFNLMLERLDIQPHEAIFVDDNPHNVAAAESVGMTGIIFTTHDDLQSDLTGKGVIVAKPVPAA